MNDLNGRLLAKRDRSGSDQSTTPTPTEGRPTPGSLTFFTLNISQTRTKTLFPEQTIALTQSNNNRKETTLVNPDGIPYYKLGGPTSPSP